MTKISLTLWATLTATIVIATGCVTFAVQPENATLPPEADKEISEAVYEEDWSKVSSILKNNEKSILLGKEVVSGVAAGNYVFIDGGASSYRNIQGKWQSGGSDFKSIVNNSVRDFDPCLNENGRRQTDPKCLQKTLFTSKRGDDNLLLCLIGKGHGAYCHLEKNHDGTLTIDPATPELLLNQFPHSATKSALRKIAEIPYHLVETYNKQQLQKKTDATAQQQKSDAIKSAGCEAYGFYKVMQKIDDHSYRIALPSGSIVGCNQRNAYGSCDQTTGTQQYGTSKGTMILLKTDTLQFTEMGVKSNPIYVKKSGQTKVKGSDGFDQMVDVFVQSAECEKMIRQ